MTFELDRKTSYHVSNTRYYEEGGSHTQWYASFFSEAEAFEYYLEKRTGKDSEYYADEMCELRITRVIEEFDPEWGYYRVIERRKMTETLQAAYMHDDHIFTYYAHRWNNQEIPF
jgi:hypothetical protein